MISAEDAEGKVKEGWIRVWMAFEVLAINEKAARDSLEWLMNKLDESKIVKLYKKEFGDVKRIEKPLKDVDIEEGFSNTCEIEMISKKLVDIVQTIIEYGPSAIEVLEPLDLKIKAGEAQEILNSISQMMHKFAAAGIGGILMLRQGANE